MTRKRIGGHDGRPKIGYERPRRPGEVIRTPRRPDVTSVRYPVVGYTKRVSEVQPLELEDSLTPDQTDEIKTLAEENLGLSTPEDTMGIVVNKPILSIRGGDIR